jgi:hypothetical protein
MKIKYEFFNLLDKLNTISKVNLANF